MIQRLRVAAPAFVLWSGVVAAACGFVLQRLWRVLPWERVAESLALALLALALAWPLRRWARWSWASALAAVWLAAATLLVGPVPMLAAGVLAAAAGAIGWAWLPGLPGRGPLAIVTGLAAIAGLVGWSVTWPIHHAWLWWPLLLGITWLRRHALRAIVGNVASGWRDAVAAAPRWAAGAVLLLGLASTACWLPTLQYDDLAYHLGLPSQWLAHGRYQPQPQHQVWALAPWANDVLHGLTGVLARGEARGALNAWWLALAAAMAWRFAAALRAPAHLRWAVVALLASLPLLAALAGGMHTELPATVLLLALATLLLGDGRVPLLAVAILLGGLAALKPMHLFAALPLLLYAGWCRRDAWSWRRLPLALLVIAIIGGSSYAQSWLHTGNPVLPLFNATFQSPFFALRDFDDARWHAGFDAALPWRLVFDTDRYLEGWDGGFGFVLVALAGAWLLALQRRELRGIAVAASLVLLLPLLPLQYARYAFPGLALLLAPLLLAAAGATHRRGLAALVAGLCLANLAFVGNAHWLLHLGGVKRLLQASGDESALYARYAPERALLAQVPEGRDDIVLATDPQRPFVAELGGRGRTVAWYAPHFEALRHAAETDPGGRAWQALFAASGARWLLVTPAEASPALRAGLAVAQARRGAVRGDAELWALPATAAVAP
jgi:hypothetical protein